MKCRCPNWPRMSHLDIWNTSYGQKKDWESKWQFDSWPLKVENRLDPGACRWSATRRWKALDESYKFGLDLVPIRIRGEKLWMPKVPGVQTGIVSGFHFGSSGKKSHLDVASARSCREYYKGKVVASPESGPWWVKCVQVPVACPNTQMGVEWVLTNLWLVLDARSCNKIIVPLPNLILGLLARPSTPF